jgi:hypothetical protein
MNISLTTSANMLISNAQRKSADAAQTITSLSVQKDEIGIKELNSTDIIKPILSLKEAELETAAAAKILTTEKKSLGSILDIRA